MIHAARGPRCQIVAALLLMTIAHSAVPYESSPPVYIAGQWAIYQDTADDGKLDGCFAMAKTGDQRAGLAVIIDMTGQLSLALSFAAAGSDVPNQVAQYKIDATDFGTRRGDIGGNVFNIPLGQDPMLGKLPGAKQVTVTLRGTTYVFNVSGGDQVMGNLNSCLTAPLSVGGNAPRGYKADTPASVITLTCRFKPARGTPDSVSEQPIDISFDEANNRILNREVVLGPQFTESNIRWREPTNDNHFVDYELDRHSGAARIYYGGPKEPLVSVGMCQLAQERRF